MTKVEWKSIIDEKPSEHAICLVVNYKGYMGATLAIYEYGLFVMYTPGSRDKLTLEVSHFVEIPELPVFDYAVNIKKTTSEQAKCE